MTVPTCEFSRLVPLARLAAGSWCQEIVAEPEERRALAARFDLFALDRLTAAVELHRANDNTVLLRAALEAAFVQSCVVSLEPVAGTLSATFELLYGPPEAEATATEVVTAADEPAFEPFVGEYIDIGEAVAQELSLRLPLFPRLPDAEIDVGLETEPGSSAFAVLAGRTDRAAD